MLYYFTGNVNKLREGRAILGTDVRGFESVPEIEEIQSTDPTEVVEHKLDTALTLVEFNSSLNHAVGKPLLVEDVSLDLECLNGLPGPYIKSFIEKLGAEGLAELAFKYNNQRAVVRVMLGFWRLGSHPNKSFFSGEVSGTIVMPRGKGWDFDPIFQPDGFSKTFAEMAPTEKNNVSMRRLALQQLADIL